MEPAARRQLLTIIDRLVSELTTFIDQNKATIENAEQNNAVKAEVVRDQEVRLQTQGKLAELDFSGRNLRVFETADPAVLMVLERAPTERSEYGIERDGGLVGDLKLFARAKELS